jgi:hypothetical protein
MDNDIAKKIVVDASLNYDKQGFSAKLVNGTIVTETGMIIPKGTPMSEYQQLARTACTLDKISQWAVGDIIVSAEREHGEAAIYGQMYPLLAELWGRDEEDPMFHQHVRNIAYVSRNVPKRIAGLSWSHHREVASLPEELQMTILSQASSMNMTVKQLSVFAATYKSAMKAIDSVAKPINEDELAKRFIAQQQQHSQPAKKSALPSIADAVLALESEEEFRQCCAMIVNSTARRFGHVPPTLATTMYDAMGDAQKRAVEMHIRQSHGMLSFDTALDEAIHLLSRMNSDELQALNGVVNSELKYREE